LGTIGMNPISEGHRYNRPQAMKKKLATCP
jgi:hypothetical protein